MYTPEEPLATPQATPEPPDEASQMQFVAPQQDTADGLPDDGFEDFRKITGGNFKKLLGCG